MLSSLSDMSRAGSLVFLNLVCIWSFSDCLLTLFWDRIWGLSLRTCVLGAAGHFPDSRADISLLSNWACAAVSVWSGVNKNYALACPFVTLVKWPEANVWEQVVLYWCKISASYIILSVKEELLSVPGCGHTHTPVKTVLLKMQILLALEPLKGWVNDTCLGVNKEHCNSRLVSDLDITHFYNDSKISSLKGTHFWIFFFLIYCTKHVCTSKDWAFIPNSIQVHVQSWLMSYYLSVISICLPKPFFFFSTGKV